MPRHISGREATYMAIENDKRRPVRIEPSPSEDAASASCATTSVAVVQASAPRKVPPRVRKPSLQNDRCVAPTPDLEAHRGALRLAFGDTLSDEFAEVMLGKLITALRPGPAAWSRRSSRRREAQFHRAWRNDRRRA